MKRLTAMARFALVGVGLVLAMGAQAQPVYKWVDAEGRTHYGSQLPTDQADAGQIKVSPNGSSGAGSGRFGEERNPDGTKKLPKQVREMADGVAKGLSKVDSKEVPLNCAAAVDNIHYQADQMLEVGQKNVRDGYMAQAEYDKTAPKIREARGKYSVSDCQASSGNKKSFYQCMSSSNNHVMGCDKQFKHGE